MILPSPKKNTLLSRCHNAKNVTHENTLEIYKFITPMKEAARNLLLPWQRQQQQKKNARKLSQDGKTIQFCFIIFVTRDAQKLLSIKQEKKVFFTFVQGKSDKNKILRHIFIKKKKCKLQIIKFFLFQIFSFLSQTIMEEMCGTKCSPLNKTFIVIDVYV